MTSSVTDPPAEDTSELVRLLSTVLADRAIRTVFQPIVDLESRSVVAFEALSRGPEGPLESPDTLFATARQNGSLRELDELCRATAFVSAASVGLVAPLFVFVNVEPEVLDSAPVEALLALADDAPGELRIVVEITERALTARPAELLRTADRVRELGWGLALDDVGADPASLAFMALLRPDVVKLDLSLVQQRPTPAIAEIMSAVNAYAERTGALVLAEGVENERHLGLALALGASLGQGWLFGRPTARPVPPTPDRPLVLLGPAPSPRQHKPASPFTCLQPNTPLRRSAKHLLVEVSKHLEQEALRLGEACVVASSFQHDWHFTPLTSVRYEKLGASVGFVCVIGEGLAGEVVPRVRGASLDAEDPMLGEWDVVILSPHFSAALLARDLGDDGPERDRTFEYALTYDRETVIAAARSMLARLGSADVD